MKKLTFALVLILFVFSRAFAIGPYTNNGNGTVTDKGTDLQWQQATADTNYNGVINTDDLVTWEEALAYCENLALGSQATSNLLLSDWRVPNIRELNSIVDGSAGYPAINPIFEVHSNLNPDHDESMPYFSSTTRANWHANMWAVDFYHGLETRWSCETKTDRCFVRCVRAGWGLEFTSNVPVD